MTLKTVLFVWLSFREVIKAGFLKNATGAFQLSISLIFSGDWKIFN